MNRNNLKKFKINLNKKAKSIWKKPKIFMKIK